MTSSTAPVTIVTGAAGGIGSEIVQRLLAADCAVVGVDLVGCPLTESERLRWVRGDLTTDAALDGALAAARELGGVRAFIGSAFADYRAPLEDLTAEQIAAIIDQQVVGAWRWSTRLLAERDTSAGDAAIVHISSVHARFAAPGAAAYAMAKSALTALTRAMAVEWGPRGVRCNAVEPGFVPVPRNAHRWQDSEAAEQIAAHLPLRRVVTPADVAEVAVFLAGPQSAGVTGVCVPVDAGMGAALPGWA